MEHAEFRLPSWSSALVVVVLMLSVSGVAVGQTGGVVYSFQGGRDGNTPTAGLISDQAGNFYGTTSGTGHPCSADCGTVFQLTPPAQSGGDSNEAVLHRFKGGTDGENPVSG